MTEDSEGKTKYFPAECVIEGIETYDKSKNYLICYHPHSLYGIHMNIRPLDPLVPRVESREDKTADRVTYLQLLHKTQA